MGARGVFACAVLALHLLLRAHGLGTLRHDVLAVREKWCSVEETQTLPWIKFSTSFVNGNGVCVRLRLRINPLPADKTLRIEVLELANRNRTLFIWRDRRGNNTIQWKKVFDEYSRKVKIRRNSSIDKNLDVGKERVWELRYACFRTRVGNVIHVNVYDFNRTLVAHRYKVKRPPEVTSKSSLPEDQVPVYQVTVDAFAKQFIVDLEPGHIVTLKLCYKSKGMMCNSVQNRYTYKIDTDLNHTVTLNLPHLVPCACVQVYYSGVDNRRQMTCPLEDRILPGGGEVLSSSSLQFYGTSVLKWTHLCTFLQSEPDVSLCWQHAGNHSQCSSGRNSVLLMRDQGFNVSDVDKHAHMCLKFSLNESHHIFCPFNSGDLSEWDVTVVPGPRGLYLKLSSSIRASFAAQLCVEDGESCVTREAVHTVHMDEGAKHVELIVPLPFFTSGLCVQVWRSEPALRGRRIICPDYSHRRWGLIVAASLALLVAITTLGILTYSLIKRQTLVWRAAERKPVLLVCSSDEKSHVSAVCALACGLQEELHMDVRLAQWAHCSTQTSLAQLGPAPWLFGQCQQVHSAGGMVLIAWSSKAQQTFLRWREREGGGKAEKDQKQRALLEDWREKPGPRWPENHSSITAPVFKASLVSMWAGLQSDRHGQGFGLVCFRGLSGTRCIPKQLRGIRRYCLPRDLSNLIHELDADVHRTGSRVQNASSWCCWRRLFSKGLSFWLSQRLARRLDTWLPEAAVSSKIVP